MMFSSRAAWSLHAAIDMSNFDSMQGPRDGKKFREIGNSQLKIDIE